jgi:hypothetical protein
MEALVPTALNTLPALTHTPDGNLILLVLNGVAFLPVGASPPFSVTDQTINWLSAIYSISPGDDVSVAYSYSA